MRLLPVVVLAATAAPTLAAFIPYSGPAASTQAAFLAGVGTPVPVETFESFAVGATVGAMPNVPAFFSPEYANGSPAPLPVIFNNSPVTPTRWIGNTQNGRPAWSPWIIRPTAGQSIYAFGQINSQGDWVRIQAFDAANILIGTVDAQPLSHCFAGFTSTTPIAKVVITPLGNFDGTNGMDNIHVSTTPIPAPATLALIAGLGLFPRRRRS